MVDNRQIAGGRRPEAADFYSAIRGGGGLWSLQVSNRLASYAAAAAARRGWRPDVVTTLGGVTGVATSGVVLALVPERRRTAALVALIGWQAAYALDCGDGQLARVTKDTSNEGALLDLLFDYAVQGGVSASALALLWPELPTVPTVALTTGLGAALFDSSVSGLLLKTPKGGPQPHVGLPRLAARSVRDYGSYIVVLPALVLAGQDQAARAFVLGRAAIDTAFVVKRMVGLLRRQPLTVQAQPADSAA